MKKNAAISLVLVTVAAVAVLAAATLSGDESTGNVSRAEQLVRPDSQRLSVASDGKVTFVESWTSSARHAELPIRRSNSSERYMPGR